ncbi:MAG: hypothetical protein V4692_15620 [Bdellovibrionota bacterium]
MFTTSINAQASLDCRSECLDPYGPDSKCAVFGLKLKHSVKTFIDLINNYSNPPIRNVSYTKCPRLTTVDGLSVSSVGKVCTEWSVQDILRDPSEPDDRLEGNYGAAVLPEVLNATFSGEKLTFDASKPLPQFKIQTNGEVVMSGDVSSILEIVWGNERQLVMETEDLCYAVIAEN